MRNNLFCKVLKMIKTSSVLKFKPNVYIVLIIHLKISTFWKRFNFINVLIKSDRGFICLKIPQSYDNRRGKKLYNKIKGNFKIQ